MKPRKTLARLGGIIVAVAMLCSGCGLTEQEISWIHGQMAHQQDSTEGPLNESTAEIPNGIDETILQDSDYEALHREYEAAGIEARSDGLYYQGRKIRQLIDGFDGINRFTHYNDDGDVYVEVVRSTATNPDGSVELMGPIQELRLSEVPPVHDANQHQGAVLQENPVKGSYSAVHAAFEDIKDRIDQRYSGAQTTTTEAYELIDPGNAAFSVQDQSVTYEAGNLDGSKSTTDTDIRRFLDSLAAYGITYQIHPDHLDVWLNGELLGGLLDDAPTQTTFYGYSQETGRPLAVVSYDLSGNIKGVETASSFNDWRQANTK